MMIYDDLWVWYEGMIMMIRRKPREYKMTMVEGMPWALAYRLKSMIGTWKRHRRHCTTEKPDDWREYTNKTG